jgi:hypothetical protein
MPAMRSLVLLAILVLSGCAVGNTVDFRAQKPAVTATTDKTVTVAVLDQRGYVISGDKAPNFVGIRRGGFGNPFDVTTRSGGPLAGEITVMVVDALKAQGIEASAVTVAPGKDPQLAAAALAGTSPERGLVVLIGEWRSDLYMNMEVDYDLTAQVLDAEGALLASSNEAGNNRLGQASFEKEVSDAASGALKRKLEALLNDPAVVAALK